MLKSSMLNSIVDLIFPPMCPLCREEWCGVDELSLQRHRFCRLCLEKLENSFNNFCLKCGLPLGDESNTVDCKTCRGRSIHYDRLLYINEYATYIGDLVLQYKYHNDRMLVYFFADWLYQRIQDEYSDVDLVIPVPMHWYKKLRRGYNQAELLAYELAKRMAKPFETGLLKRKSSKQSQAGQSRTVRYKSVKGLYYLAQEFSEKKILLVDDVATTGSTLSECAGLLKSGGCEKVYCATIAGVFRGK